jgi:hypothetical protein
MPHANTGGVQADRADRGGRHFDPGIEVERHAEREQQGGADHVAMADDRDPLVRICRVQVEQGCDDALLHRAHALAAGQDRDAAMAAPQLPARIVAHRIEGRSGPFAVVEFDDVVATEDRQPQLFGDDRGGLARALHRARIERADPLFGEAGGEPARLGPAAFGQADPRHAPDQNAAQQGVFAMPDQMESGHERVLVGCRSAPTLPQCALVLAHPADRLRRYRSQRPKVVSFAPVGATKTASRRAGSVRLGLAVSVCSVPGGSTQLWPVR